ncbi:P2Y purinoceptor 11 [Trichosurus vulpecula]|uniref:P2Y purinoceptor 11 n=1 Tax=Trichosurus vulpecula TaxID=9337 RepID=UPI00186B0C49|nr:P2Y purinoceptor 11 [Trichosurus vulpecula]
MIRARNSTCSPGMLVRASKTLSQYQEDYLWPVLVVEFLVAVGGNGLVLYRFSTQEQRPWHPAIIFSAQLAVSDLLYAFSLPPLVFYFYPPKHWSFGAAACLFERFLFNCNLYSSIFFITCISLNRYLGIVHPFFAHGHVRPKHAWAISLAGWGLVAALAAPTFKFSHLVSPQNVTGAHCRVNQPEGCTKCLGTATDDNLPDYWVYSLVLAVLGCGLPFLLTLLAYSAIAQAILTNPNITRPEKLKVGVLVGGGIVLYAMSYIPYHIMHVLNTQARQHWLEHCSSFSDESQAVAALDLGLYLGYQASRGLVPLAMCFHPLLYTAVASSLRCSRLCGGPKGREVPLRQVSPTE